MALLIRRHLCGRPRPFGSVRNLGGSSGGCSFRSSSWASCTLGWLPAWLPVTASLSGRLGVVRAWAAAGSS
jgi:hypothetical protein